MTEAATNPARPARVTRNAPSAGSAGPGGARLFAGAVGVALLGILIVAAALTPAAAGHGTHTQLGLTPCSWAMAFGRPCPTCGMTTAFAHAARGDLGSAFRAQPLGCLMAVGVAAGFWGALHVAATGSHLGRISVKLLRPRVLWLLGGAAAAAWAYKWATWG